MNTLSTTAPDSALARAAATPQASIYIQIANAVAILLPVLGLFAAVAFLWGRGFSWLQLGLFLGMYLASAFGVTVGYHRLFTHSAFETYRPVKIMLAILGSMAVEGPVLKWVATHRMHHQHSDDTLDPHSPHLHGGGLMGMLRGLWHSHMGWIFRADAPNLQRYITDLSPDRALRWISQSFSIWVFVGLIIPTALGGLLTMSWLGALEGFVWGGLVRIFFVHHITWSINSACHLWGSQPYRSHDESRNNVVFGLLAFGEGWHNNHHAFPTSARHGLSWWQIDISYLLIRVMELIGLVWKVRLPSAAAMAAKRTRQSAHESA